MHPVDLIAHQSFSCLNYAGLRPFFDSQHPRSDTTPRGFGRHTITAQGCAIFLKVSFDWQHPGIEIIVRIGFHK